MSSAYCKPILIIGITLILVCRLTAQTNDLVNAKRELDLGITYCKERDWDRAISKLSNAIRLASDNSAAYEWRGCAHFAKGELDRAISDFDQVIRLDPTNANAFQNRGNAYGMKLEPTKAIKDLTESLRLSPQNALTLALRGQYHAQSREFEKALQDYQEAIRLDPKSDRAHNGLGWLRATCPVETMRNQKQAVEAAAKACDLTNWKQWQCINTLAAAFAEAGDFDKAVKFQKQAMSMTVVSDNDHNQMQQRLSLYKRGQPYRDVPQKLPEGPQA